MESRVEHQETPGTDEREAREPVVKPMCPRCGWRNTRPSNQRTTVDAVLEIFSVRAFRCRSCGNRFRTIRRGQAAAA